MSKQVFLSYSRRDKTSAVKLSEDLSFRGISTWIDLRDIQPGAIWSKEIEDAIAECPYFLLMLSPNSIDSDYVRQEYEAALARDKIIIPLIVKPCPIPPALAHIQCVDLTNYQSGLMDLLRAFPESAFGGSTTLPNLLAGLKSTNPETRVMSLTIIGRLKLAEAIDETIAALKDSSAEVRTQAAWALDNMMQPNAIPMLVDCLNDKHFDVRSAAGWALVHLGTQVVPAVSAILRDSPFKDTRDMARQVLSRIGGEDAFAALKAHKE